MPDSVTITKPKACDLCQVEADRAHAANGWILNIAPAVVDGKTKFGPWANMCQEHFDRYGVGLGTGRGQRLIIKES